MAEHLEGFGRLLEFDHRLLVARIAVGVVLERKLAVRFGNLILRGSPLDAKDLIIAAFIRHRGQG